MMSNQGLAPKRRGRRKLFGLSHASRYQRQGANVAFSCEPGLQGSASAGMAAVTRFGDCLDVLDEKHVLMVLLAKCLELVVVADPSRSF